MIQRLPDPLNQPQDTLIDLNDDNSAPMKHIYDDKEPRSVEEALSGPYAEQWNKAMAEELESLERNETWDHKPIPKNKTAIGCKWVFRIKTTADNTVDRFKATLVAQGFSQKFGFYYCEVFAPVAKSTSIRAVLSIPGKRKYYVKHLDVKTAFLNGKTKEMI